MIEFHCTHCDKALKTSGDKAGRQAKCPGCGGLIEIPPSASQSGVKGDSEEAAPHVISQDLLPSTDETTCPSCGEVLNESAIRCHGCGKIFEPIRLAPNRLSERREIRPFPPGEVIAEAWRIYTEKLGLLIGSYFVNSMLSGIVSLIGWMPFVVAEILFERDNRLGGSLAVVMGIVLMLAAVTFTVFLQCGYQILQLKVAREEQAESGDLFSGNRFTLRMFLNSVVFGLMVGCGTILCLLPGAMIALIFWPYAYALVDQDRPGLGSLARAKELTDGNWGSLLMICVVAVACVIAGYCACGIGLIFAVPYVNLLFAVSYDRMSCQTDQAEVRSELDRTGTSP